MTNQTEQGATLPDKPNYHPWAQSSEFEPSGNSGELTDEQADAIARTAFARHTGRTEWEGAQRWVLEAVKSAARPSPEGSGSDGWEPITTAPKDTTLLVGYPNQRGKWRTVKASYYLAGTLELDEDSPDYYVGDDDFVGFAPEGWYEESETHEHIRRLEVEPTHWRRLPAAPITTPATPGDSHAQ